MKELTSEIIKQTPDAQLRQLLFDYTFEILQKKGFENQYEVVMTFSQPLQVYYVIDVLEMEINNGGFGQFFTNSSGEFTLEAIEFLKLIKAEKTAKLLEKAISYLEKHELTPNELRERLLKKQIGEFFTLGALYDNKELIKKLGKLDDKFLDYEDDINQLLINYLRANENKIAEK